MAVVAVEDLPSITDPELVVEQIISPATDGRRYPYFHRLRELAPVHRTEHPALRGFHLVSSFALASEVLMKAGMHSDVMGYMHLGEKGDYYRMAKNWMFHQDSAAAHERIRNHFAPHFTPKAIGRYAVIVEDLVHRLLDRHEAVGGMEMMRDFAFPLPVLVIARVLGLEDEDVLGLQQIIDRYVEACDQCHAMDRETEEFRDRMARDLQALFGRYIEERRRRPRDDLISALATEQARTGRISDAELVDNFVFALIAGHTTTTDMIGNMTVALWRHPQEREKLRADPARIPAAVTELMRFDSSIAIGQRYANDPIELNAQSFPAGTWFTVVLHAANRDPARFDEPDRLNLDRNFARRPIPFGGGRYMCLGSHLARLELETVLRVMLLRFPMIEVTDLQWPGTLLTHGPKKLQLEW